MKAKQLIILGGTGFIGSHCVSLFTEAGYEVIVLTRKMGITETRSVNNVRYVGWDGKSGRGWSRYAATCHGIVNLAGENIAGGRWNRKRKALILESRVEAGRAVVDAVKTTGNSAITLIQASAVGFYGNRGDQSIDENSSKGTGFLPGVTEAWEDSTGELIAIGVKRIVVRFGVVLGFDGGMLKKILPPFRFFAGGVPGNGDQWIPWIHIRDGVRALRFLMEDDRAEGIFNITAPSPCKAGEFYGTLGKTLGRPVWVPMPASLLRLAFGDMAEELMLSSQRVYPLRLGSMGFEFHYPEPSSAFRDLVR